MHSGFILVIDDDIGIREALSDLLADEGHQVVVAANGEDALQLLRTSEPPCMILLDLMMPVMNGWQFAREKSADPRLATIPMCIITAGGAGQPPPPDAQCVLPKPFPLKRLLEVVGRHC